MPEGEQQVQTEKLAKAQTRPYRVLVLDNSEPKGDRDLWIDHGDWEATSAAGAIRVALMEGAFDTESTVVAVTNFKPVRTATKTQVSLTEVA